MSSTATTIACLAEELCEPHLHHEVIVDRDTADRRKRRRRLWTTTQSGLLGQLREAAETAVGAISEPSGSRVPGSRPPGSWEALSRHSAIAIDAIRWCWNLKLDVRDTVEGNIRQLVGAAPSLDDDTAAQLLADLRSWRHQAAVMTGWASPAFRPAVDCPAVGCGRHGTIRINVDRLVAWCPACENRWDDEDGSIRTLARYIEARTAGAGARTVRIRSGHEGHGAWLTGHPMAS